MRDILFAEDGDIDFTNGDVRWGESTGQHMRDLIISKKGVYRCAPSIGADIESNLADDQQDSMTRAIKLALSQDGMKVSLLKYVNGKLNISATY